MESLSHEMHCLLAAILSQEDDLHFVRVELRRHVLKMLSDKSQGLGSSLAGSAQSQLLPLRGTARQCSSLVSMAGKAARTQLTLELLTYPARTCPATSEPYPTFPKSHLEPLFAFSVPIVDP